MNTDTLLDVPATTPRWQELKEQHLIHTEETESRIPEEQWEAWDFSVLEDDLAPDWEDCDPEDILYDYDSVIRRRGGFHDGETEREAVVGLIQKRQLDGWEDANR